MKHATQNTSAPTGLSRRVGGAIGLFLTLGLLLTAPASASFEQVATFADNGGNEPLNGQLYFATGMAVNTTGAGGVPVGTVYAVALSNGVARAGNRVLRYSPTGEFRAAWGWGVSEDKVGSEYERCGLDGEPAHPVCRETGIDTGPDGAPGAVVESRGIAVDQATGNVYVLNTGSYKHGVVQVFSADGVPIANFGERADSDETIAESPEKLHTTYFAGQIAVDSSGTVYVADYFLPKSRVMVFKPQSPGDYEHYVYTGSAHDLAVDLYPSQLAVDSDGNFYINSAGVAIYEFAPGDQAAPICEYKLASGGILGVTVNPDSGEVFYFSEKNKKMHQLSACSSKGEFVEKSAFTVTPATGGVEALAFNPALSYEVSRPSGILYAADGEATVEKHSQGHIFAPAVVRLPVVESESVSAVTSSTATLGAQINPKGSQTRYAFQYITDVAYEANEPSERFAGATEAPFGGAVLGNGQESLSAAVALVGLAPDTEYHYRVIATSHCDPDDEAKQCEAVGLSQVFHTFPAEAPGLADNRAYELVSPAQKNGGEVLPAAPQIASCRRECKPGIVGERSPMQSAPEGEAVVYQGYPFSFTEGARQFSEYLSRRTPSGWQTTILSPRLQESGSRQGYKAFDAQLSQGLLYQVNPSLTPDAPSGYANLYTQPTTTPSTLNALLKAEPPNRQPGQSFVLVYAGASADFSRLFFEANDALTEETPFAPEAVDGGQNGNNLYEFANSQLSLVNVLPGNGETVPGAEFGSGEQLGSGNPPKPTDFSHAISADGSRVFWSSESGQVYVRENGESTRVIPDPGKFLTAAADGSEVLLDSGHIYDLEAEQTIDLTQGEGGFKGIVGQSEDLSRIYFVDTAGLTGEEENEYGAKAQVGQNNLYAWHEGDSVFVATLAAGDNNDSYDRGAWTAAPSDRNAEASPDGRWAVFLSRAPLTGYDSTCTRFNPNTEKFDTGPCFEVFLYDSTSGKLICPSCSPSGQRPLGRSNLSVIYHAEGSLPQPRYLTDEGRLYFDSQDSLTPFDTNDGVEDVYQYEPEGIGSCKREGGCVSLISAGHEPIDSNFLTMDETGKNVFFTTRDQLVLKDRDDLIDLYVAREGGGLASETETGRSECQGEACQTAITPPNDPTPGSSTFEGAGNVDEKKAAKKKQHKKKRKHAKKHKSNKRSHGRAANNNRGGAK